MEGASPPGHSEARRDAVQNPIAAGEVAHFFPVSEEWGSVRDGEMTEFQAAPRFAVEIRS